MPFPTLNPQLLRAARHLCRDADDNEEYVRGVAELLIDSQGPSDAPLTMNDDKDALIDYLVHGFRYEAQFFDGVGGIIEECASNDPREIEKFVRRIGSKAVAHDDARYDGDGSFVPGYLRWFEVEA